MGAATEDRERERGREEKKDKNIHKVGSIIGCASLPFLCESTAQSRTVEAASSPSETLHFPPLQFPPTLSTHPQGC